MFLQASCWPHSPPAKPEPKREMSEMAEEKRQSVKVTSSSRYHVCPRSTSCPKNSKYLVTGVTNPLYGGLPQIALSDFTGNLGGGQRTSVRGPEGSVNVLDQVSWLHGKHAFKFGFGVEGGSVDSKGAFIQPPSKEGPI